MRYKIGAEQVEEIRSLVPRPHGLFNRARTIPVGPTRAVDAATGAVACGIKAGGLNVLDQGWEAACFSRSALAVLPPSAPAGTRKLSQVVPAASSTGAQSTVEGQTIESVRHHASGLQQ